MLPQKSFEYGSTPEKKKPAAAPAPAPAPAPAAPAPAAPAPAPAAAQDMIYFNANSKKLKDLLLLFNTITTELKLVFYKDKIKINSVDPAHVQLINLEINKSFFEEYKVVLQDKDYLEIGIDLTKIISLLKTVKKGDMITLNFQGDQDFILIKSGLFLNKVGLISTDNMPDAKMPVLNLDAKIEIDTKTVFDFLVQAEKISDYFSIKNTVTGLVLYASGDVDNINLEIPRELLLSHLGIKRESKFSVDYLLKVFKILKNITDHVLIRISDNNPIEISSPGILILTAPRIETEE